MVVVIGFLDVVVVVIGRLEVVDVVIGFFEEVVVIGFLDVDFDVMGFRLLEELPFPLPELCDRDDVAGG